MARTHPGRGGRKFGDQAAAGLITLLIGTAFFLLTFAVVISVGQKGLNDAPGVDREFRLRADSVRLSGQVLGEPGIGWYEVPCTGRLPPRSAFQPEEVRRFALGSEPCPGVPEPSLNLSHDKIRNIRNAGLPADPTNGRLDYEEARRSLAMVDTDFHVRGRVTLPDVELVLTQGRLDPHLRPLYVGDYRKQGANWVPQSSVRPEAAFIDAVIAQFEPNAFLPLYHHATLPYAVGGDVVPDAKDALDAFLPVALPAGTYNVLVVGSNVDQVALNSGPTKFAIESWVRAGGTLLVLGNNARAFEWLEPLFHVGLRAASGALVVAEPDHAVLHIPNELVPSAYVDGGNAWDIAAQDLPNFEVVLNRGGATLAVSREGAYGDGRVILTSFRPFDADGRGPVGACDPAQLAAACEGLRLMQNFLTLSYQPLNFDYGPEPGRHEPASVTQRLATVWVPALHHVELTVWVSTF